MEREEEGLPAFCLKDEADTAGWEQEPPHDLTFLSSISWVPSCAHLYMAPVSGEQESSVPDSSRST